MMGDVTDLCKNEYQCITVYLSVIQFKKYSVMEKFRTRSCSINLSQVLVVVMMETTGF